MNKQMLLDAISARRNFAVFANAFRQNELDVVGQGWTGTRAKLEILLADTKFGPTTAELLEKLYLENLLFTNKAVFLWSIDRDLAQSIADAITSFVDNDSPYKATYPLPLAQNELSAVQGGVFPTAVHNDNVSATLVFTSKRYFSEEEVIPSDRIPDSFKAAGYTELVAKRHKVSQVFDSITILPSMGLVELRIDAAKTLSEKDILKYRNAIVSRFNNLVQKEIGEVTVLGDALNLVDALAPLYKGKDWIVQKIGHVNEGGYINANRGRYRSHDVRKDKYHLTGEGAVQHLQLWTVTAVFPSNLGHSQPSLTLEGHSKMLSMEHPFMDLARILECTGEADYNLVLGTLLECLSPPKETLPEEEQVA